jgi:hypothetical protein
MVGKVLAWKKAQPEEAERVWKELGESNGRIGEVFAALKESRENGKEEYEKEVERLSRLPLNEVCFLSQVPLIRLVLTAPFLSGPPPSPSQPPLNASSYVFFRSPSVSPRLTFSSLRAGLARPHAVHGRTIGRPHRTA